MRFSPLMASIALALSTPLIQAADQPDQAADQAIRKTLMTIQPDLPIEDISASAMPGLFQVQLKGGRLLYASADGQFILQGNMYHMQKGELINLTEQHASRETARMLAQVPVSEMVVFAPEQPKTHITVFTDPDCGYCQKLHSEVPELNRLGIEVRYMAFPRQGVDSHGYNTLVSIWCSKDRQAAMSLAKQRKEVPLASCTNPVASQYELGQMIGVNGTPAIILANGQLLSGYQPARELAELALQAK